MRVSIQIKMCIEFNIFEYELNEQMNEKNEQKKMNKKNEQKKLFSKNFMKFSKFFYIIFSQLITFYISNYVYFEKLSSFIRIHKPNSHKKDWVILIDMGHFDKFFITLELFIKIPYFSLNFL